MGGGRKRRRRIRIQYKYTIAAGNCKGFLKTGNETLEFYNRDKGRKALNLTEKYKKECWQQRKSKTSGKRE